MNLAFKTSDTLYAVWMNFNGIEGVYASLGFNVYASGDWDTAWVFSDPNFDGYRGGALGLRRAGFPTMGVDTSGGPYHGRVYVAWLDERDGDPDVYLMYDSLGDGYSWSVPIRVNDDSVGNGRDQYHPWLTVDPGGGVNIVYYDGRNYPDRFETWFARSTDGGASFVNFRISDVAFEPCPFLCLTGFIGDYIGITSSQDFVFVTWMDNRIRHPDPDADCGVYQAYLGRVPIYDTLWVSGHVVSNTDWSGTIILTGDVTIDSGVTVTLRPWADVRAVAFSDDQVGGLNDSLVELIVAGELRVGTDAAPPSFRSTDDSIGSWYGIWIAPGGELTATSGARIADAVIGITIDSAAGTMNISGFDISRCDVGGILCISDSTMSSSGVTLEDLVIHDVPEGYGIYLYEADPLVRNCVIDSCEEGIKLHNSSSTLRGNTISGPGLKGISITEFSEGGGGGVDTALIVSNVVNGYFSTAHLSTAFDAHCAIDSCEFKTNYSAGSQSSYGVKAGQDSWVRMRRSQIVDFAERGFYSYKSEADLGMGKLDEGDNQIHSQGPAVCEEFCLLRYVHHVGNSATDTLFAEYNYWWADYPPDPSTPQASWFTSLVDYTPWLDTIPAAKLAAGNVTAISATPREYHLEQNYPNPFNPSTVIAFSVENITKVRITVYNVLGQVVTVLAEAEYPAGRHQVIWDGTDDRGRQVSSGVYLYRLQAGRRTLSRKMVLLK